MALIAITTLNIPGITQSIVFNNPSQVDQINFVSNNITFTSILTYNLSKNDFLVYFNYLDIYNTALLFNFPYISGAFDIAYPQCEVDFKVGATRITYFQKSGLNIPLDLSYQLSNSTMTFAARPSSVTITLQEFFFMVYMLRQYKNQIFLN